MEPSGAPWRVIDTTEPQPAPADAGSPSRGLPWAAIGVGLVAVAIAVGALVVMAQPAPLVGVEGAADLVAVSDGLVATRSADPASEPGQVVVDVGGAVLRPGVYRLANGVRVADAIEAAGGYGPGVDAAAADRELNLAAVVRDGEQLRVPVRGEIPAGGGTGSGSAGSTGGTGGTGAGAGGLIDVNSASAEALDTLPGVGPATAAKIIAAREEQPFAVVDDLLARKVVGPATMEKLRALVTVGP